mmetsp:Transcript_46945/g.124758  ORF Transcript_46945/g.124758 Transcript_46945/m.124758 type:complete len:212 (+) Transcript_46945:530-1165(+)
MKDDACDVHLQSLNVIHRAETVRPLPLEPRDDTRACLRQCPRPLGILDEREEIRLELVVVIQSHIPQGYKVGTADAIVDEVLLNLTNGICLRTAIVDPIIPDIDVNLGANHVVWDAQRLELCPQLLLHLRKSPSAYDNHLVEVPQSRARNVVVTGASLRASSWKVPETRAGFVGEGIHRDPARRLVDAHRRPKRLTSFRAGYKAPEPVHEE